MYVDSVTTAAIADELTRLLVGGRIQDVIEVDPYSIGLEIYAQHQRRYLLITADPQAARCHLVPEKLRRGVETSSPLGLLLRKYVGGAHLEAVTQPPWERTLRLDFSGAEGETSLIVETMDQRSNIILTAEDDILDCIRRIGPAQNRYRILLPGRPYVPPPPQNKMLPDALSSQLIDRLLQQDRDKPAWQALVSHIAGVSPLLAREVIYRASGEAEAPACDVAGDIVYQEFHSLIADVLAGRWSPCVVPAPDSDRYLAFAAYPLIYLGQAQPRESISVAMTDYFGAPVGGDAYAAGKQRIREQLADALDRLRRKLSALARERSDMAEIEALRKKGELLLAYAPTIPPYTLQFEAQYEPDSIPLVIDLDPALNAIQNAHAYFERYEKAKRAAADLPNLEEATRREVEYLEQLGVDLDLAASWPEIDAVREALQEGGYWRGKRARSPRGGRPGVRRFTTDEGFVILVGRNAAQNHQLVTERSAPTDLWLHARNLPGSHVIVKHDGRPIPEHVIRYAAQLAATYSAGRFESAVEVDVTERRYVRPIKGGKPGQVTYHNERTLIARPSCLDCPLKLDGPPS